MGVGNRLQNTRRLMKLGFGVAGVASGASDPLYEIGAVAMAGARYTGASCFCIAGGCHAAVFRVCKLQSNE
jgi:hypothetical protein